ncbi:MAG: serine/threonine protein kinase [Candidatus Paceibacteria bacterium]|jgi:serine/threonine protein kinase
MIEGVKFKSYNENIEPHVEMVLSADSRDTYVCAMVERIFDEAKKLGEGRTAKVFPDSFSNGMCHKVIYDKELLFNDVEEEAGYLDDLVDIDSKARVPQPIMHVFAKVVEEHEGKEYTRTQQVLMMEEIKGFSIKDLEEGKGVLPEDFEIEPFMEALRDFFLKMHKDKQIYHRDFHEGNLMIDYDTNLPAVIDFGHATRKTLRDENPYRSDPDVRNKISAFLDDDIQINVLEGKIRTLIDKQSN